MASDVKNPAPAIIHKLVETFEQNLDSYRSTKNETELRREFLDKFFTALGWDVSNEKAYDEAGKEVVHEFSVEISGQQKKADYAFRVGRGDKFDFLVEAKKPSIKIESSQDAAFQIRRYGWSAKLPINILTDFEHFAVYDCRAKPNYSDKASTGRILLVHYKEYAERWDEIASIFSPEAVRQGSFAKYAEGIKGKKGTADVDDAFLQEIERWRELLAKNIALRNEEIDIAGLNYAVQMTIDRIVFLRICEERGIEAENQLLDISTPSAFGTSPKFDKSNSGSDSKAGVEFGGGREGVVYRELCELFKRADTKYNSGLFHFKKEKEQASRADDLTLELEIDDKVLKDIISNLYYPKSPYAFLYIPSDILGQVYERFLGKVIRLTAGHQAKVEEKPEVRKAGGVYYTPTYIVDYIVKNTVGQIANLSTPKEVAKLKIVDPACGSGTFLLGAYQFLLDWHLNWYMNDDVEKWEKQKAIWKVESGYRLTTAKKKEILLNNIHGVDIDAQAVEVTKLSLLLKVLENASGQMGLGIERVLPDLGNNIKCGNSLIGFDYFEGQLLPDEEERARVNPFDWKNEFKDVFAKGGFDVAIGNPPYIFTRELLSEKERNYYSLRYKLSWEKQNTFMIFMELLLKLLRKEGKGGYIVPNSWLTIESAKNLRPVFIPRLEIVADLNYQVFEKVSLEPCIFIISGQDTNEHIAGTRVSSIEDFSVAPIIKIDKEKLSTNNHRIVISESDIISDLIDKIVGESQSIEQVFDVRTGLQAYEKGKGNPPQSANDVKNHVFDRDKREDQSSFKYLQGKDVGRYKLNWSGMWMQYGPWLSQPREIDIFRRPRVLIREITSEYPKCLETMFIEGDYLNNKSILNILHQNDHTSELKMLAGILNSRLMSLYYKQRAVKSARKIFPKVVIKNVREFPYPKKITNSERSELVQLVEQMLAAHKSLVAAQSPAEKERLERQIEVTDRAIDGLVYELYGLTEEEIRIVES